jgi:hypothetical protein
MDKLCHCGHKLHFSNARQKRELEEVINRFGENITINYGIKKYLVPRTYIALHGIRDKDISKLGFKEITDNARDN